MSDTSDLYDEVAGIAFIKGDQTPLYTYRFYDFATASQRIEALRRFIESVKSVELARPAGRKLRLQLKIKNSPNKVMSDIVHENFLSDSAAMNILYGSAIDKFSVEADKQRAKDITQLKFIQLSFFSLKGKRHGNSRAVAVVDQAGVQDVPTPAATPDPPGRVLVADEVHGDGPAPSPGRTCQEPSDADENLEPPPAAGPAPELGNRVGEFIELARRDPMRHVSIGRQLKFSADDATRMFQELVAFKLG